MCRETKDSIIKERTRLVDIDRAIERLSHELTCLLDLGALTSEEESALSAFLEDLRTLLARAMQAETPAATDRPVLFWMARLLAGDLDIAYQRLSYAA